jgi:hypothetical protein
MMLTWDFSKISCSELEHACSTGKIPCQHAAPFPDETVCVFITAVPIIKPFGLGEGVSGGHVLREMTSRGLCGLVL